MQKLSRCTNLCRPDEVEDRDNATTYGGEVAMRTMIRHLRLCPFHGLAIAIFLVSTGPAFAQNKTQEKKKTAVNFEDQLIQGELNKPEFFYFLQRKQFNFGRLIKFRENFLLEMKKTSEQVERKGANL